MLKNFFIVINFSIFISQPILAINSEQTILYTDFIKATEVFDFEKEHLSSDSAVFSQGLSCDAKRFAIFSIILSTQFVLKNGGDKNILLRNIQEDRKEGFVEKIVNLYLQESMRTNSFSNSKKMTWKEIRKRKNRQAPVHLNDGDETTDPLLFFKGTLSDEKESVTEKSHDKDTLLIFSDVYQHLSAYRKMQKSKKEKAQAIAVPSIPVEKKETPIIGLDFFEQSDSSTPLKNLLSNKMVARESVLFLWKEKINKLKAHLKFNLIGQDAAVEDFSDAVFHHYAAHIKKDFADYMQSINETQLSDLLKEKKSPSSVIIVGPSGTGKTEMVRLAAAFLEFPFGSGSGANLSAAGYKGDDPSDSIIQLINSAESLIGQNYAMPFAEETGIIFLDEIDKTAVQRGDDTFRHGTQNALLTFIEGTQPIKVNEDTFFDTSNIFFVLAGAFSQMIPTRLEEGHAAMMVMGNDLIKYGLRSELVNRIARITQTVPLTPENLRHIILHPTNSPYYRLLKEFNASHGLKISITSDALDLFCKEIEKDGIGARNLYGLFLKLIDVMRGYQDRDEGGLSITVENVKRFIKQRKERQTQNDEHIALCYGII